MARESPPVSVRRAVIFGAPLLAYVAAVLHPEDVVFGEDPWPFIAVHLAFMAIICLLAWMVVFLVDGLDGAAAAAARILTIPFAVAYATYTAFGGVAVGAFVWKVNELPAGEQQSAAELVHSVSHSTLVRPFYPVASLLWLAAMLAVVVALRRRAPLPALALVAVGSAAFAWSHVSPWGPAGMAAVLAGVVWLELRRTPVAGPVQHEWARSDSS